MDRYPRRTSGESDRPRCAWCTSDPLYIAYHDEEWGIPLHNDQRLFEMLCLEGAQAGLSWLTILRKREHYRRVFEEFDPEKVARFRPVRLEKLLQDSGIVRNRLKVMSAVDNAKAFLRVQKECGTFDAYLWRQAGGRPRVNSWNTIAGVPSRTPESDALSRDLRSRGFRFVGSTICYAFMQAVGLVDDHTNDCWRRLTRR